MTALPAISDGRRELLRRRIRLIVAFTIAYNVFEATVALAAGTVANSTALIGFGLDSVVEVLSAVAVAWQFAAPDPHSREHTALRLIAVSFFGLAAFVSVDAAHALITGSAAEISVVGMWLAAASLAIMPTVSWIERKAGREIGSASAVADSKQTLVCAYLSAALLAGLLLNAVLGWWWADAVSALVIAGFAVREGLEAWKGDGCATGGASLLRS
jgi:divalent metal cation (Fe/Co/Zn/Cd) transporter